MTVSVRGIGDVVIEPSHITCDASCTTTVVQGAAVTITANAADGFVLASWHGACAGTDGDTCVIHPDSDASITVVFAAAAATTPHGLESDAEHDCRHNSATAAAAADRHAAEQRGGFRLECRAWAADCVRRVQRSDDARTERDRHDSAVALTAEQVDRRVEGPAVRGGRSHRRQGEVQQHDGGDTAQPGLRHHARGQRVAKVRPGGRRSRSGCGK